jgi:hypothetical protein
MVDARVAAQSTMQLRGAYLDLGTAVALGFGEKTRERLPEIFGIRHPSRYTSGNGRARNWSILF